MLITIKYPCMSLVCFKTAYSLQPNAKPTDWQLQAPDMNHTEHTSAVRKTIQETWPTVPPRNSNDLWPFMSDVWDERASPWH